MKKTIQISILIMAICLLSLPGYTQNIAPNVSDALDFEIAALNQNKKIAEVYLIGGQSNATGQGYMANMVDSMKFNNNILIYHSGKPHLNSGLTPFTWQLMHQASESPDRFGPELGFASRIKSGNPNAQIAIIKHAHSGSNLYDEWNPGANEQDTSHFGFQYKEFLNAVDSGLDSLRKRGYEPIVKGMLWQQGESEAYSYDSISVQYGFLLKHFIGRVREPVNAPMMSFVYGYVCPPPINSAGIRTVREAEHDVDQNSGMALATRMSFVIGTDDLSHRAKDLNTPLPNDDIHFGTDGIWVLGVRMAEKMNTVQIIKVP